MSRIYSQSAKAMTSSSVVSWAAPWDPLTLAKGPGFALVGTITGRARNTLTDSNNQKFRHMVLTIEFKEAYERQYTPDGKEVEIVKADSQKVRTGYLHSSYKDEHVRSDKLTKEQVHAKVDGLLAKMSPKEPPRGKMFEFWGFEDALVPQDFVEGDTVRLKVKGDSPFIESIARLETAQRKTVTNFAGGDVVGQSWTEKLQVKGGAAAQDKVLPQDELEGVDDDEWDD